MKAKLTLLVYLLLIPAAALGTAKAIKDDLDSQWQSALEKAYPQDGAKLAEVVSLGKVCADSDMRGDLKDGCTLYDRVNLMDRVALGTGIIGIVLLASIALAGRLARRRRRLLLALFRPGLHLTMLTLSLLTFLHAGLGIAAIYYGESVFLGQLHVKLMFALAIGGIVGIVAMLQAQWSAVKKVTTVALGKRLSSTDQPTLWQFVRSLAKEVGTAPPDSIVVGLAPNFYVTQAEVICLDGKLNGRTMYLSLPLCRILSRDELKAVLGHELGHYRGLDTRFSQGFYPIYRGTQDALVSLSAAPKGGARLALLPAIHMLSFFLGAFSAAEREISRERELAADAAGAALCGTPSPLAAALVKVHAFTSAWGPVREGMVNALAKGKQLINGSTYFQAIVGEMAKTNVLDGIGEEGPPHPTDSHPPLSQRLAALKVTMADIAREALGVSPATPAITLLENVEVLEQEVTNAQHVVLVRSGAARLGAVSEGDTAGAAVTTPKPA